MATKKKSAGTRAKKTPASAPKASRKIAGVVFTKRSCHTTKSAAAAEANKLRAVGKKARVIKSGKALCVYARG